MQLKVSRWGGARLALLLFTLCLLVAAFAVQQRFGYSPAQRYYDRGVAAANNHQLASAIGDLRRAIAVDPRYGASYELLAAAYTAVGRVGEALDILDRLRTVYPNRPHLYTRIAETYLPINNVYALRWAREAVVVEPRSPHARYVLALALDRSGDPRDGFTQMRVGDMLAKDGRLETPRGRVDRVEVTQRNLERTLLLRLPHVQY